MPTNNFSDQLWNGLSDAVADIREKVVEEPMWGRAVTEREAEAPQWPQAREVQPDAHESVEQNHDRAPDQDIER